MKKIYKFLTAIAILGFGHGQINAQCLSTSPFGSGTANSTGSVQLTTCAYAGEYSTVTVTLATSYNFISTGGAGNYITITDNTNNVVPGAFGNSPLAVAIPSTGVYRMHVSVNASCLTDATCHTHVVSYIPPSCSGAPAAANAISSASAVCAGINFNLSLSTTYTTAGITYQWQSSATGVAGSYTSILTGTNAALTQSAAATTFYQAIITCSAGPVSTTATAVQVIVNPTPTISVSPSATTICSPGATSVILTASGGVTYTWTPAATLSSPNGATVTATPIVSTAYSVTGSNAGGCNARATAYVFVVTTPTLNSISASPSVICSGLSSTLQSTGTFTTAYSISKIPYSAIATPSTGVTVLCNNGTASVALSSGSLDDGGWSNQIIPFNFTFFGTTTNSFAVSTNGFLFLGAGNPLTFTGYGTAFPSATPAKPAIGANYADLDFDGIGSNSRIQYFVTGTTPNQQLTISWTGQFFPNTGTITTQATLYESTNVIEVHTFNSTGNQSTVEGIQNAAGTVAFVVPGRNAVTLPITTPDAFRWTPGSLSYTWSPSTFLSSTNTASTVANNATASTVYSVTLNASNGCAVTGSTSLVVNTTSVTVNSGAVCPGNSFTMVPSGASTYTFSSGPVVTPTATSNYSVVGTGTNGCISAAAISTVVVNASPTISVPNGAVCSGSSFTLVPSGASTYTFSSGPVVTPSVTSSYSVTGTSTAGCVSSNTAVSTVSVNANPTITVAGGTICSGSSFTLSPSGASTYTFSSGPVVSPSVTSSYSVTGTSTAGCVSSAPAVASVSVNTAPAVSAASSASLLCAGQTASLTANGAATYSWNTSATTTVIAVSPTVTTVYTVIGTTNGCSNTFTISQSVSPCTGINGNTTSLNGVLVYPNPNTGVFTIELNNGSVKNIEVMDLTGRVILSSTSVNDKVDFNINTLANGVYYVRIQSNNAVEVIKIVKQ